MRLFVALDVSAEIREQLVTFMAKSKQGAPGIRFVRPEGLHITLKFLGRTPACEIDEITSALDRICHPVFRLSVAETGFFPDRKRPRIFWAGIKDAGGSAVRLAANIGHACTLVGFAPEANSWRPHITLARLGRKSSSFTATSQSPSFGMMMVTEFHLYESTLHPQGSIYRKIASFPLKP